MEQASPVVEMGVLLYRRRLTESNLWCCKENYTILHTKIKVGTSIRMVLEHEFYSHFVEYNHTIFRNFFNQNIDKISKKHYSENIKNFEFSEVKLWIILAELKHYNH